MLANHALTTRIPERIMEPRTDMIRLATDLDVVDGVVEGMPEGSRESMGRCT